MNYGQVAAILAVIMFFAYIYYQRYSIKVKKYTVKINNLPPKFNGFNILHLSDLHCKKFGKNQKKILNLIDKNKFDVAVITGDIAKKGKLKTEALTELIKGLNNKPVYFVTGNHDWGVDYLKIKEVLRDLNVKILENWADKFIKDDEYIWIIGVDDPVTHKDNLDKALKNTDNLAPRILLAHAPNIYPKALDNNIDLVLVGHTHAGQVRIPFYGGALIAPRQGIFPRWDYGVYENENVVMIINGGLGESVLPLRINNRPEIVMVTLVQNSNKEKAKLI